MDRLKRDPRRLTSDDVNAVFRFFDRDGDGYVSVAELQLILDALNERPIDAAKLIEEGTAMSSSSSSEDELKLPTSPLHVPSPIHKPVSAGKMNKIPPLSLAGVISDKGGRHSSDVVKREELNRGLSFDEFSRVILSAASTSWRAIVSRHIYCTLNDEIAFRDEWESYRLEDLLERSGKRYKYNLITSTWTESVVRVKIDLSSGPFARGSMRECFRFKKMSSHHTKEDIRLKKRHTLWHNQHNYVAKRYVDLSTNTLGAIKSDVVMQVVCKHFAREFNARKPKEYVDFLDAWILVLDDEMSNKAIFLCEAYVPGPYKKCTSTFQLRHVCARL